MTQRSGYGNPSGQVGQAECADCRCGQGGGAATEGGVELSGVNSALLPASAGREV